MEIIVRANIFKMKIFMKRSVLHAAGKGKLMLMVFGKQHKFDEILA